MWKHEFSKEDEIRFRYDIFQNDLIYIRIMCLLCVFFYALFSIADFLTADLYFITFLKIRFVFVIPLFIITFTWSFFEGFYKVHQYVMTAIYVAAGVGIAAMLIILPGNFSYYGGMFLIFGTGHFLTRIRWNYVLIGSVLIILSYILGAWIFTDISLSDIFIYTLFYTGFVMICGYGSYTFDRYKRKQYYQASLLTGDKVLLEKQLYDNMVEIDHSNRITIYAMAKLADSRDHFTGDHIDRVGEYCLRLSGAIPEAVYTKNGVDKEKFMKTIELASVLHDIGKIGIPEHILLKPGKLTDDEMDIMKTHSNLGYDTLLTIKEQYSKNDFINMGLDICKYHHERWDGTGYPDGLKAQQIPLSARVVSIIDVYDALISERPYKKAYAEEKAVRIIRQETGKMFDPDVVEAFLNSLTGIFKTY